MYRLNNSERELWINNDEGLYRWYRLWRISNKGGIRAFIRENREELDGCILRVLGREPG